LLKVSAGERLAYVAGRAQSAARFLDKKEARPQLEWRSGEADAHARDEQATFSSGGTVMNNNNNPQISPSPRNNNGRN
jgi:hypothetical protein